MFRITLNSFRSRIAWRLFAVFAVCGLAPVLATGFFGYAELARLLDRQADNRLADFSANYGLSLIGRLKVADSLVRAAAAGDSRRAIGAQLTAAGIFRSLQVDAAAEPAAGAGARLAVERDPAGVAHVVLRARGAERGAAIRAEIDPTWLWGADEDLPQGIQILVLSREVGTLHAAKLSDPLKRQIAQWAAPRSGAPPRAGAILRSDGDRWRARQWPVFLDGQFKTANWAVVGVERDAGVFSEAARLRVVFPALLLASIGTALLLSIGQIRRFLGPLETLIEGTRRVARRDFSGAVAVVGNDEFGELATSFNRMSGSLQRQFTVLETVADVDRMLLQSPDLEQVLDRLLPRIAESTGCTALFVVLLDPDAPQRARVYDFAGASPGALPVRRVTLADNELPRLLEASPEASDCLLPLAHFGVTRLAVWPIRQQEAMAGLLCLGYDRAAAQSDADGFASVGGFADRLSVVLTNVAYQQNLYHQAHFDGLTALPNRQMFHERLAAELDSRRDADWGALLYIDLDHFKQVNDTVGHGAGDELLRVVAQRIGGVIRAHDTLARLGGDEFAVVLAKIPHPSFAGDTAARVIAAVAAPIRVGGREFRIGASIGITMIPTDGRNVAELLKNGDLAMYRAKETGRGQFVYYEPEMQARMLAHAALLADLQTAIAEREFELHYQPIVGSADAALLGAEALIRWRGANGRADRSPAAFIPLAEETGMIVELGAWVLEEALRRIAGWRERGGSPPYLSVNVSSMQLRDPKFVPLVEALLLRHQVPPALLQFEIVESVVAQGAAAERALAQISQLGIKIALDDFGTGYSSLSYLRTLPVDCVKIDRSFIKDVPQSADACSLVKTIIALSHALGKPVIAEGVETDAQRRFLCDQGCEGLQGYLIARPMPAQAFERQFALGTIESAASARA